MAHTHGQILVVDDDKTNRLMLSIGLKQQGHAVTAVENGRLALELLRSRPFDLVLLDIVMPEMNGFEVLSQLKADPELRNIPVIIISAIEHMESVVSCIEMGAEDHLPKPFDPILLQARINASLQKKRFRDQEVEYMRQVDRLTEAAVAIESQAPELPEVSDIAARPDALGTLARVFQHMAREVQAREQQLSQDNRVKAAFIDVITHELRSPFVSATLSAELLRRYLEHGMLDELREQVKQLDKELLQGRQLIETIIAFAAQVGKSARLNIARSDVVALVRQTCEPLQRMAEHRQLRWQEDLPAESLSANLDSERLQEALHHLVHNAIKFSQAGGVVSLRCWREDDHIFFEVGDTGPGIPPDRMASIWNAFSQQSDRLQRGVEGLGLGLAIVKATVEAHRGQVMLSSAPGQGSRFGFWLPADLPDSSHAAI